MKIRITSLLALLLINTMSFAPALAGSKDSSDAVSNSRFSAIFTRKGGFEVNLEMKGKQNDPMYLKVYDKNSTLVYFRILKTNTTAASLDMSQFAKGDYELVIKSSGYMKKQTLNVGDSGVVLPAYGNGLEVNVLEQQDGRYKVAMVNLTGKPVTIQVMGQDRQLLHNEENLNLDDTKTFNFNTAHAGLYDLVISHNGTKATKAIRVN